MSNPYSSPEPELPSNNPRGEVTAPAVALMIVAGIAIAIGLLSLAVDLFLLLSGFVDMLEENNDGPVSKHTSIIIRSVWGLILVVASSYVFNGAIKMKNLQNNTTAKTAAIVALIPCLGPCCVLGIPFGIWALVVLSRPHVKDAFGS